MDKDCWSNALAHIKNKKRYSPKQHGIIDTIPVFKVVGRNLFNIFKLLIHRASLSDTAAALSACTKTSITGKMLEQTIIAYVVTPIAIICCIPYVLLSISIGQSFFAILLVTAPLIPVVSLISTCAENILEEMR
jgi:hypothetical protein